MSSTIIQKKRVGVLGGGQLGRMMGYAAHRLGIDLAILDPKGAASPAGFVVPNSHMGPFNDEEQVGICRPRRPNFGALSRDTRTERRTRHGRDDMCPYRNMLGCVLSLSPLQCGRRESKIKSGRRDRIFTFYLSMSPRGHPPTHAHAMDTCICTDAPTTTHTLMYVCHHVYRLSRWARIAT